MKLSDFLEYEDIVIQCHDNPDGDALASGYGIMYYLAKAGRHSRMVYSGRYELKKSNLLLMVKELNIPIEYIPVEELEEGGSWTKPELLITVDCQYGEGNVTRMPAENIAEIDHHQLGPGRQSRMSRIMPALGSCSTIIYQMLNEKGISIAEDENLSTALYYGLLTDTNNFAEVSHPMDRNLQDDAKYRPSLIRKFRTSNLSLKEIEIAGDALLHYYYDEEHGFAIVEANPCDPNILGMISDMILEVDVVKSCLVYSIQEFGTKLSVRSCVPEVHANDLVEFMTEGIGTGGGHVDKAGGFIKTRGSEAIDVIFKRMKAYFTDTETIDASKYEADLSDGFGRFLKLPVELGFVKGTDVAEEKQEGVVRTLEGDQVITILKDSYIIIGISGEIYTMSEERFHAKYQNLDKAFLSEFAYAPELIDRKTGNRINLVKNAQTCVAKGTNYILARCLAHRVKLLTTWDREHYYLGKEGDYLAVREDDNSDIFIIPGENFESMYAGA